MAEETGTAVVKREGGKPLGPLLALEKIAQHAHASGMFKHRNASGAYMVAAMGYELGLSPVAALTSIHCIEGKPVMSANLMLSLVYASGTHDVKVKRRDNDGCVLEWFRKDQEGKWEKLGESSFTKEDATRAGLLNKDNWRKYPKSMYFSRAASDGFKTFCPHLAHGHTIYTPDEMGADVDENGEFVETTAKVKVSNVAVEKPRKSLADLRQIMEDTRTETQQVTNHYGVGNLEDLTDDEVTGMYYTLTAKLQAVPLESEVVEEEKAPAKKKASKK